MAGSLYKRGMEFSILLLKGDRRDFNKIKAEVVELVDTPS
jgi:hypothetical protein